MMGGEGSVDDAVPLGDIELSAIGEAMNQMIGSSSTSISQMIKMKIDIGTPQAFLMESASTDYFENFGFTDDEKVACVSFRMEVDSLIDSKIMQLLPVEFAIDMVKKLRGDMLNSSAAAKPTQPPPAAPAPTPAPAAAAPPPPVQAPAPEAVPVYAQPQYMPPPQAQPPVMQNVNVQPVQFQSFDVNSLMQQKENMGIVMDVPLEISVELGRTKKKIREILEFTPGTIVELDKMAGEPIDILVNGKFVAKGEVVVVMDENFGIRITDIVGVEDRI
jgi:flagellar motor switch protein FliN/FliY